MKKEDLEKLKKILGRRNKITIIPHKNPDGDALGSCLALYHFLALEHHVKIISPNDFPHFLKWLPGSRDISIFVKEDKDLLESFIVSSDLIFILDFNALFRADRLAEFVGKSAALTVMIDHHEQPDTFDIMYSDPTISSTAEMVCNFLKQMGDKQVISPEIATCLYAGIMTDTGSFRYPATSAQTHRIVADLMEAGADKSEIHNNIYGAKSISHFKLIAKALNNLVVLCEYGTSYTYLSFDDLQASGYQKGDTEGIVNYGLSLKGIIFTVIFIEDKQEGIIKMSLRSEGNFDVNRFARTHFKGGGHHNAAGARTKLSLSQTIENFKQILPKYKRELNKN